MSTMTSDGRALWPAISERERRTAISDEYPSAHNADVLEKAMRMADSFNVHGKKKFIFSKKSNFMRFAIMVISILTYLMVLHGDIYSQSYNAFLVQLGVSTALIPSIYRVSSMFLRMNLASPILDLLIVVVILVHQLMAAIVLLLVTYNPRQYLKEMLYITAALLFVGVGVCFAEIGSAVLSTKLQRRSSSSLSTCERSESETLGPML